MIQQTQTQARVPASNSGYLHILACGEVSLDKISGLDITRDTEFQRHRDYMIGEGSYGQVYSGWHTGDNGRVPVAVKALFWTTGTRAKVETRLMREIITWKRVSKHENVADFLGLYRAPNEPSHLVMPFYKNNNFLQYMEKRPDERLARAKDIARGLDSLHGSGVIHGDIKPENTLISDAGHAQLSDFGVAVILELQGFTTTVERNVRHSAPELIPLTESPSIKPTKKSDIFSLGILFLQLFDGRVDCLPYDHVPLTHRDPGDTELLKRIHGGDRPRRGNYPTISDHQWNIIAACWVADPATRPTIQTVRSWLKEV